MTVDYEKMHPYEIAVRAFYADEGIPPYEPEIQRLTAILKRVAHEAKEEQRLNGDGWVSVEERLPQDAVPVAVLVFDGTSIWLGFYSTERIWIAIPNAWYMATDNGDDELGNITHWMHLPTPPKTDSEKGSMK